ncbi:MAG: hypothetical protein H9W81_12370 [Enterococcus sp.]|nr:hypothetical protein [Enterococcus sp.]
MPFPVTAPVPVMYQWENIKDSLVSTLRETNITEGFDHLCDHYAWLLHITSWNYGFDWDPKENVISLEIPFDGRLMNLDTTKDSANYDDDIAQDAISLLMSRCLESVPVKRLLAHFHKQ